MAAPYEQSKYSCTQQMLAGDIDNLFPNRKEQTNFNTGTTYSVRPFGSSESSTRFAPGQFRPTIMHQPPPHAAHDIRRDSTSVMSITLNQISERTIGYPPTDLPRPFFSPPVRVPFPDQRIRPSFITQQQMNSDSTLKQTDLSNINHQSVQSVGTCVEDRKWLEQWLHQIQRKSTVFENQQSINLSEIQVKTRHMLVLIAKLQKQKQILETLREEDKSIWDQKVHEIERIKAELDQLQSYLTSDEIVTKLDKKIMTRKKKRERLKRLRQERYDQQHEDQAQRELIHSQIDKNLEKIRKIERDAKQEKDLQKEVDNILGQVRKKITENSRATQLLHGLQKLRQMRKDRQERQGVHITGVMNDNIFNMKVGQLSSILAKQDQVYKAEESALKVILESEQEETREKEREKDRQQEIDRQIQEQRKAEHALFGSYKEPRPDDPLYPFKQYYDAASNSFEAFLSIRRDWDKYLVLEGTPGGSRIPESWVIPAEPSSDPWASALTNR